VESFRLDDPNIPPDEKRGAIKRARQFFRLSRGYARHLGHRV
jgi:aminoglycoside phosphotransferase family enzyme